MSTHFAHRTSLVVLLAAGLVLGGHDRSPRAQGQSPSADRGRSDDCSHVPRGRGGDTSRGRDCRIVAGGTGVARGDFNADGFGDLAIGVPGENLLIASGTRLFSVSDAGQVTIIYGSLVGLLAEPNEIIAPTPSQVWHQNVSGVLNTAESGDEFGAALASGDFNGDGFSDLAVAVPGERDASGTRRGAINVLLGSPSGLTEAGDQFISGTSFTHQGQPLFLLNGLGWGDFNNDGFGDLIVEAASGELGVSGGQLVGGFIVIPGSASGLTVASASVFLLANAIRQEEGANLFDVRFAAGDIDGNGFDDLVVGKPLLAAGEIEILDGSAAGLTTVGRQVITQSSTGLSDNAIGDEFGSALAVGDFDGDSFADVAVGVPSESVGSIGRTGEVEVIFGSAAGANVADRQRLRQGVGGMLDTAEAGDQFGAALAAADFNGDGRKDLAIGAPGEDVGSTSDAGAVSVIHGTATGLSLNPRLLTQTANDGVIEANDNFGAALTAWNFGGSGAHADLAIGVPSEDVGTLSNAGAVNVAYGSANGLTTVGQFWTSDSGGIGDVAEAGDRFGSAVY